MNVFELVNKENKVIGWVNQYPEDRKQLYLMTGSGCQTFRSLSSLKSWISGWGVTMRKTGEMTKMPTLEIPKGKVHWS